jgi:hypothetical protein
MVGRESLTANVAPGGARNTLNRVDPRKAEYKKLQ